jgi:nicotinamidase-related amidase
VDELKPQPDDGVVRKTRYDGFYGTFLEDLLRVYGVKLLVITRTSGQHPRPAHSGQRCPQAI